MSNGNRRPTLAIVSGRPGSGKTTLARALAAALSWPRISRDEINEGIRHTFRDDPPAAAAGKEQVAKLTFGVFFEVLQLLVSANVPVVADAAFQDFRWRPALEPIVPIADIRIIHCVIDPELAHQRILRRRLEHGHEVRSKREPAGQATGQAAAESPALRSFEPLSLPVPSIHVGTADGYDPGLDEIVAFLAAPAAAVRTAWPAK